MACHLELLMRVSPHLALSSNFRSLACGDKVLIKNEVYGYESAIKGKRATVVDIDEQEQVTLKLDEKTGHRED